MGAFLEELKTDTERNGHKSSVHFHGHPIVTVRPAAFKALPRQSSQCGALCAVDRSPATATIAGDCHRRRRRPGHRTSARRGV
jgi:hypothetical protein